MKANYVRFVGIFLGLIISSSVLGKGAFLSWVASIGLIAVIALSDEKYPILKGKGRAILIVALVVLVFLLYPIQWEINS